MQKPKEKSFSRLLQIMDELREGCPWDKKQTPSTFKENLIEESYECIEAINENNQEHIKEELGDLFLLVTMLCYMYEEKNVFTTADVLNTVSEKLTRRHPHVFGNVSMEDPDQVIEQWESIKKNIEGQGKNKSIIETIPKTFPPLDKAYKMQKKAKQVGFDWEKIEQVWDKVQEEFQEFKSVCQSDSRQEMIREYGDLLFSLINVARFLQINPSVALHLTNTKFEKRFRYIEEKMKENGQQLHADNFKIMYAFWEESKTMYR